jgi:hypothetical protein
VFTTPRVLHESMHVQGCCTLQLVLLWSVEFGVLGAIWGELSSRRGRRCMAPRLLLQHSLHTATGTFGSLLVMLLVVSSVSSGMPGPQQGGSSMPVMRLPPMHALPAEPAGWVTARQCRTEPRCVVSAGFAGALQVCFTQPPVNFQRLHVFFECIGT